MFYYRKMFAITRSVLRINDPVDRSREIWRLMVRDVGWPNLAVAPMTVLRVYSAFGHYAHPWIFNQEVLNFIHSEWKEEWSGESFVAVLERTRRWARIQLERGPALRQLIEVGDALQHKAPHIWGQFVSDDVVKSFFGNTSFNSFRPVISAALVAEMGEKLLYNSLPPGVNFVHMLICAHELGLRRAPSDYPRQLTVLEALDIELRESAAIIEQLTDELLDKFR